MIQFIIFLILIQVSKAEGELYTIYADGSIQYYSLMKCYHMFFPHDYYNNKTGKNESIITYMLGKDEKDKHLFHEYHFFNHDCSGEAAYLEHKTSGYKCSTCEFNVTQGDIESDTFASLLFTPKAQGDCDKGNQYVSNKRNSIFKSKCGSRRKRSYGGNHRKESKTKYH